ncbi:MAG: sulfotransferase domain-containing protein [Phycisphaerales bacterium]|nr:sulfotransferase domain-containing protein [Phycisphaerales bacterium]
MADDRSILRGKPLRRLQRAINQRRFHHPYRCLLVVGQPKSGTTWLTRLLCEVPGYLRWTPSSIKIDSHHFRPGDLSPPPAGYTVVKCHAPPTDDNVRLIHESKHPYVLSIRDPRDLAVSWSYYVGLPGRDKWANPEAVSLEIPERLDYYIERVLPRMMDWARGWTARMNPAQGIMVRYEDMLADARGCMASVYAHCGLTLSDDWITAAVERNSFRKATGREPGQGDAAAFNRKGIAGDWRNHFTDAQKQAFKGVAGAGLVEMGYEQGTDW